MAELGDNRDALLKAKKELVAAVEESEGYNWTGINRSEEAAHLDLYVKEPGSKAALLAAAKFPDGRVCDIPFKIVVTPEAKLDLVAPPRPHVADHQK